MSASQIDILLICPNSKIPFVLPPLGLGYLASHLLKNKITTDIKDCLLENISTDEVVDLICKKNIKIIGITCNTNEVPWVRELVKKVKSQLDVTVIVGGPHPSGVLEKIYEDIEHIDFAIYSEGEYSLFLLTKAILENDLTEKRLESIPNLIWKDNYKIIKNLNKIPEDLDELDFPAWHLINPLKYSKKTPPGIFCKAFPFASMITTRGCNYNCSFCASAVVHGRRLRSRSADNVINEIAYLSRNYGIKEIFLEDDNFAFNKQYVKDFCKKIIDLNFKIFFSLPNGIRVDTIEPDILELMKKANFYSFALGIESGSQRILQKMNKRTNLDMIRKRVSLAKKYGFYITGFFIIGYPDETLEEIDLTIKYAKSLKIDKLVVSKYTPFPGTESYNSLILNGEISSWQPFEPFGTNDIPYSPKGISKDELRAHIKKAIISWYLRPSVILRHVFKVKTFSQLRSLIKIIKNFLFASNPLQ